MNAISPFRARRKRRPKTKKLRGERILYVLLLLLAIAATSQYTGRHSPSGSAIPEHWEVYFSPEGGCTDAIIREIRNAKESILVQAYSFTSPPIAQALVEAHRRGVKVEAILDKSNETGRYSSGDFLKNGGIPTYTDKMHAIAHNKVILIDQDLVITGSFNFSKAAEFQNAENLLVIRSGSLATLYKQNWAFHREHSSPYRREIP